MFASQISEIVARFERKGYKLVAIKLVVPSKEFAEKHYYDLKERPFFNGLCEFLSSGPVLAMVSVLTQLSVLISTIKFLGKCASLFMGGPCFHLGIMSLILNMIIWLSWV